MKFCFQQIALYSASKLNSFLQNDTKWGGLKAGQVMSEPKPVFARIETIKEAEDAEEKTQKKAKNKKTAQTRIVAEA